LAISPNKDVKEQVKFLQAYKCKNSLGPWALELGPKIPVTTI